MNETVTKNHVVVFVNGIFTSPGREDGWVRRAVTWTNLNRPYKAESFEYFSTTIDRSVLQGWRSAKLAKKCRFYLDAGWSLSMVAHSNGADVVLDSLRDLGYPKVTDVHLIAPAVTEDCEANGINKVVADALHIYRGGRDMAMRIADTFLGRMRGFGALGMKDPVNLRALSPVHIVDEKQFDHDDWFAEDQFPLTMQRVCPPR